MAVVKEIWRDVVGYEERYEVSDLGRVRAKDYHITDKLGRTRIQRGRPKRTWIDNGGYERVELCLDGKRSGVGVHRVVAEAFIVDADPTLEVMHLDHNPLNNRLTNLAYGTHSENIQATVDAGRHRNRNTSKSQCPRGHKYSHRNTRGDRVCAICKNEAQRRYVARKKANGN